MESFYSGRYFTAVVYKLSKDEIHSLLVSWRIWKYRNKILFKNWQREDL
jgi:hypothetical protein